MLAPAGIWKILKSCNKPKLKKEDIKVSDDNKLQAEIDSLKQQFSAAAEMQKELAAQNAKLEAENAKFAAEKEATLKAEKVAKFATAKKEALDMFEQLVKADEITPGQRDEFMSKVADGDIQSAQTAKFVAETLKASVDPKKFSASADMQSKDKQDDKTDELPADQVLVQRINKTRAETGLSFSAAKSAVLKADPVLARDYINLTKEI